jgi:hypothetical protein
MGPVSTKQNTAVNKEISTVTKLIWESIKTNRQPVAVIVDSNKQKDNGGIIHTFIEPTLHYLVIRGVREDGSGNRYFSVYDPADALSSPLEYKEADLRYIVALPYNTPEWVYRYGNSYLDPLYYAEEPAYMLTVEGE